VTQVRFFLLVFFGSLFLGLHAVHAAPLVLDASLSLQKVGLNQPFEYRVSITGSVPRVPTLKLPILDPRLKVVGRSQSSSVSIGNRKASSSVTFIYMIMAVATGNFTIPPSSITYEGTTYQSKALSVVVTTEAVSLPTQPASSSPVVRPPQQHFFEQLFGRQPKEAGVVYAEAILDREVVYVGQPLVYSLRLYRSYGKVQLWESPVVELPEFQGFWTELLKPPSQSELVELDGKRFTRNILYQRLLVPVKAGAFMVPASKIGITVDPFRGQQVLKTVPIAVKVMSLPEDNKPTTFSGLVGEVALSLDHHLSAVTQNMPVTVSIQLRGEGYLNAVMGLRFSESPHFKIYKSQVSDLQQGQRIFEYIVIPTQAGHHAVPSFELAYFSPALGEYKVLKTAPIPIIVNAANKALDLSGLVPIALSRKDIAYLKSGKALDYRGLATALFLGLSLLLMGVWGSGLVMAWWRVSHSDVHERKAAYRHAMAALKSSHGQSASDGVNILNRFLQVKLGCSVRRYTGRELETLLLKRGLAPEISGDIVAYMTRWVHHQYAPQDAAGRAEASWVSDCEKMIQDLNAWEPSKK